jgi:phage shock protein A
MIAAMAATGDGAEGLRQLIAEVTARLAKAKHELDVAEADCRRLDVAHRQEVALAAESTATAAAAVREGRDDLARLALIRHQEHAQRAQELGTTLQRHEADAENLREAIRRLKQTIAAARAKLAHR